MNRLKLVLRVGGMLTLAVGSLFLPIGYGVSPKRDLSMFNNIADMGPFIKVAFVLISLGLLSMVLSRFLPGDLDRL